MKIKGQTRRRVVEPKGQQAVTPTVIALPDGTADKAKAVMAASETPPGPTEPVPTTASQDLLEAATDPVKGLGGKPDIRTIPVEQVEDAEFEDISDAEKAAQELLDKLDADGNGEIKAHPIDVLFDKEKDPPHTEWANGSYEFLSEGGQKLLNWLDSVKKDAVKLFTQVKLRAIAFGNSVVDYAKKIGNKLWALHDELKKNPAAPYIWLKEVQTNVCAWLATIEWPHGNSAAIKELTQAILDLKDIHEQELRRMSKRITSLETQLGKNTRAAEKLNARLNPIDTDQLKTLLTAVSQNRKVDTIDLVRAITGSSLADAKAIVEEASVKLN